MWGLMRNELQKILKNKKYLIIIGLFAALLSLFSWVFYASSKNESVDNQIRWNQNDLQDVQAERAKPSITEERKKALDARITELNNQLNDLKMEKSLESGDWHENLKTQIQQLQDQKKSLSETSDSMQIEKLNGQIKEKEYALEHDTKPQGDNKGAIIILLMSLLALGALFLSAGIAAFIADVVSKEYTYPTIKVLLTKPVSRGKILLSKYIVSVVTSVSLIVLLELVVFFIVGLVIGFGNAGEAVSTGTKYAYDTLHPIPGGYTLSAVVGSTYVIPLWVMVAKIIGLECIYIIACVSFCFLLSTVTRNNMAAMTAGIISTIAFNIFFMVLMNSGGSSVTAINKVLPFLFTSYGNVVQLAGLEQGLDVALKNPMLTPVFGIVVCLVWSAVCYGASHFVFTKRDNLA